MKKVGNFLIGLLLIAIGSLLTLDHLHIVTISFLFRGWWTLFIIIPCLISVIRSNRKTGSIIGLFIGTVLFVSCWHPLMQEWLLKLTFPFILILIGVYMLFKKTINQKIIGEFKEKNESVNDSNEYSAIFSDQSVHYDNEKFTGATITSILGSAKCDLTNSIIIGDQTINCTCIFGGIDIYVPDDVKIKVKSSSVFGGVSNRKKKKDTEYEKTIYINATCVFGGVDVK